MSERETFEITVESPHGRQSIDQFEHFVRKVKQDARDRWGIDIDVQRVEDEPEQEAEFQ